MAQPAPQKNWTLIAGCVAFLGIGAIAALFGASVQTAAFRAVVASLIAGAFGFLIDYFAAHAPKPRSVVNKDPEAPPGHSDDSPQEEQTS